MRGLIAPPAEVDEEALWSAARPDDPGSRPWRRGIAFGHERASRIDLLTSLRAGFVVYGLVLGVLALVVVSMPIRGRGTGALTIMITAAGTAGLRGRFVPSDVGAPRGKPP